MPKIPVITATKIIKILKRDGFLLDRVKGSHHVFYNSIKNVIVSVPLHKGKDLGKGITMAILKDAKISIDEFLKYLN